MLIQVHPRRQGLACRPKRGTDKNNYVSSRIDSRQEALEAAFREAVG